MEPDSGLILKIEAAAGSEPEDNEEVDGDGEGDEGSEEIDNEGGRGGGQGNGPINNGSSTSSSSMARTWSNEATDYYLELLEAHRLQLFSAEAQSGPYTIRNTIWEVLTEEMNEAGFPYNVQQCRKKLENMKRSYANTRRKQGNFVNLGHGKRKLVTSSNYWQFFDQFKPIMEYFVQNRPTNQSQSQNGVMTTAAASGGRTVTSTSEDSNSLTTSSSMASSSGGGGGSSQSQVPLFYHLGFESVLPNNNSMTMTGDNLNVKTEEQIATVQAQVQNLNESHDSALALSDHQKNMHDFYPYLQPGTAKTNSGTTDGDIVVEESCTPAAPADTAPDYGPRAKKSRPSTDVPMLASMSKSSAATASLTPPAPAAAAKQVVLASKSKVAPTNLTNGQAASWNQVGVKSAAPPPPPPPTPAPSSGPSAPTSMMPNGAGAGSQLPNHDQQAQVLLLVVEELQGVRQEIRGLNQNVEKMVDVQTRLNGNIEKFLAALAARTGLP